MATRTYKLYGANAAAATANAAAQVIIQRAGFITGWHMAAVGVAQADATQHNWELSFSSTGQQTVNDAFGPIDDVRQFVSNAANGVIDRSKDSWVSGVAIPVQPGDRLYLNYFGSAVTSSCDCYVYVTEK